MQFPGPDAQHHRTRAGKHGCPFSSTFKGLSEFVKVFLNLCLVPGPIPLDPGRNCMHFSGLEMPNRRICAEIINLPCLKYVGQTEANYISDVLYLYGIPEIRDPLKKKTGSCEIHLDRVSACIEPRRADVSHV